MPSPLPDHSLDAAFTAIPTLAPLPKRKMALFLKHSARAAAGLAKRSTARTLPTQAVYWGGGRDQVGDINIRITAPEATSEAQQVVSALKAHSNTLSTTPVFVDGPEETDLFVFVCEGHLPFPRMSKSGVRSGVRAGVDRHPERENLVVVHQKPVRRHVLPPRIRPTLTASSCAWRV